MRVLVTGAAGFLGRRVVDALLAGGDDVRALVRGPAGDGDLPWDGSVEVARADLRRDELGDALRDVDVVAHLAARVEGTDEERFAGTVAATERLLEAMRAAGTRRLVLISSYAVYDWSLATGALDESTPVEAARLYERDGYAVAKTWQERVVRAAAGRDGFELVVLRPGFVWGPGRLELAGAGVPLGPVHAVVAPAARLPLTYVENCADAVAAAARSPAAPGRTLNVVDGYGVSAWRYARAWLARERPGVIAVPVPYAAGIAVARLAQAAVQRLSRHGGRLPSALVPRRFEARFKPLAHNARELREVLGWEPAVPFDEAFRRSLESGDGSR